MSVPHSFWTLGLVRDAVPWEALPLTGLAGLFILVSTTASHCIEWISVSIMAQE